MIQLDTLWVFPRQLEISQISPLSSLTTTRMIIVTTKGYPRPGQAHLFFLGDSEVRSTNSSLQRHRMGGSDTKPMALSESQSENGKIQSLRCGAHSTFSLDLQSFMTGTVYFSLQMYLYVCGCFACYGCTSDTLVPGTCRGQKSSVIPANYSHRQSGATTRVPGTEPGSPARAGGALNPELSLQSHVHSLTQGRSRVNFQ